MINKKLVLNYICPYVFYVKIELLVLEADYTNQNKKLPLNH